MAITRPYTAQSWENGDIITKEKLANIEAGLAAIDSEVTGARGSGASAGTLGKRIDDLVMVQDTQPTSEANEIWVRSTGNGVQVPTYEEFEELKDAQDDLKSALLALFDTTAVNLLSYMSHTNKTMNGVAFTFQPDGSCAVSGTATGTAYANYYSSATSIPEFITPGETYRVLHEDTEVSFRVYIWQNGNMRGLFISNTSGVFTVPTDTQGMIFRLVVDSGHTASTVVNPLVLITKTNTELDEGQASLQAHTPYNYGFSATQTDCNDIRTNGIYFISAGEKGISAQNYAFNGAGWLEVIQIGIGTICLQIAYPYTPGAYPIKYRRYNTTTGWTEWQSVGGSNEYTFNEYSASYTLNATPTITADTNNYLASTGDQTDRTTDILSMLVSTGICRLGPGDFYINNLQMPVASAIIGSGFSTRVHLSGTSDGFAIKLNTNCMVSDLQILGANSSPINSFTETVGGRHGILWQGTYTADQTAPSRAIINNVWIRYFTGGGITAYDTGFASVNCMEVSNAYIYECCAGLNISYFSEFSKFTNVRTNGCYYGCINNGGNNVFVNCDFSSNLEYGMKMDNSQGQSNNNSHGSCVGCVFNHTAHNGNANTGIGIEILNCDNGFVFDACQIFFSQINLVDSDGVVFNGCNFGASNCDITIDGGGAILFTNNMHQTQPTKMISNNNNVHFANCYVRSTGTVVSN